MYKQSVEATNTEALIKYLWQQGVVVALVAQSCPTFCDPTDCSLSGSSVRGFLQATKLERVAISFSRGSSPPRDWIWVSCVAGRFFTIWVTGKFKNKESSLGNEAGLSEKVTATPALNNEEPMKRNIDTFYTVFFILPTRRLPCPQEKKFIKIMIGNNALILDVKKFHPQNTYPKVHCSAVYNRQYTDAT